jgi:hypothetical protein
MDKREKDGCDARTNSGNNVVEKGEHEGEE